MVDFSCQEKDSKIRCDRPNRFELSKYQTRFIENKDSDNLSLTTRIRKS